MILENSKCIHTHISIYVYIHTYTYINKVPYYIIYHYQYRLFSSYDLPSQLWAGRWSLVGSSGGRG